MNEFFKTEDGRKLYRSALMVLGMLSVFLIFEVISLVHDWNVPSPAPNTITVSGTGEATSTPNIATFSFSVSADAQAVADAQSTVTTKMNVVLAGLKNLGIADKDIQTTDYSVYPKYTYTNTICPAGAACPPSRQIPDGYTVSQTVSVKVRNIGDAGKALAVAGDNGATNISGLSMTLDDPNAPLDAARLNAIDDAKTRAEALAKRLGVHLGHVVSYGDTSSPGPIYPMYSKAADGMGAASASTPVLPVGENKVTATVNVTYEIR